MVLVLDVCILLCFVVVSCVSDQVPMMSVPLGFQISGSDTDTMWVSKNGVFSFGFLELEVGSFRNDYDNGDGDGVVVGIRYNLGYKSANVPVWTVAGGLRVSHNSTFSLSVDGRLILCDYSSDLVVWSSNTSNLGVKKANLLDNGNLVLLGSEDQVLWESFNIPTTTLLPAQTLSFPQSLRAPSTKSLTSYYHLVIHRSGQLELLWESNVSYWKSSSMSDSGASVQGARFDSSGVLGVFDEKNRSIWSVTSKDFEDSSVNLRHLRIDTDGNLRIYSWNSGFKMWIVGWQAVNNQCDVFGSCGLYSLCQINSSGPFCSCLDDGSTSEDIGSQSTILGNSGCQQLAGLDNCKSSMMVLKHTVLYGLYPPHDSDVMLNESECKEYCSNDTSCIAVTSKNDGSGLCTVKRTRFISGYNDLSEPAVSFLKECLIPQAVSARKTNPRQSSEGASLPASGRFITHANDNKFVSAIVLIGLTTTLVFITVQILGVWLVYKRRKSTVKSRILFPRDALMNPDYSALIRLTFEEIKELTNHFSYQLGPTIFKGLLPNQIPIIAKLLYNVVLPEKDFRTAVSILGGTHHRNLVGLKGFCFEQTQKILIYEYIPHGTVEKWLFENEHPYGQDVQKRIDIALGVARALAYLHLECRKCIPHGNLKLENIMLDENMVPKLMDFGLQGLVQEEAASSSSESLCERDIFDFGLILLQIATCKRDPPREVDFDELVKGIFETQIFKGQEECESVERMVKIAVWCMQSQPYLRPSVGEVVKVLEGAISVDRPPTSFAFKTDQQEEVEDNEPEKDEL